MARPSRPRLSDEERAEHHRRDRELAQRAIEELRSSDGWRNWLRLDRRPEDASLGYPKRSSWSSRWRSPSAAAWAST